MNGAREESFDVMLGYPCNVECLFCSQELAWRRQGWLPVAAAREAVYAAHARGLRRLNLLGGEVTAYPDLLPLVAFARRLGFTGIQFESNGIRLADRGFAESLARAGLTRVSVSVHGHTAELHDRLVQKAGAFASLLRGLDELERLGVERRAALVITRPNVRHLADFLRFFRVEKGIGLFQFIYPLYTGDYLNHSAELVVPLSEAVPRLEEAFAAAEALGCPRAPVVHNVPPCFLPGRLEQIGDWQDLGMEVLKPDGLRYRETRENPLYRKAYAAACGVCPLRRDCLGIDPEYLKRWGEAEIRPYPAGKTVGEQL